MVVRRHSDPKIVVAIWDTIVKLNSNPCYGSKICDELHLSLSLSHAVVRRQLGYAAADGLLVSRCICTDGEEELEYSLHSDTKVSSNHSTGTLFTNLRFHQQLMLR